jgi:hypothetical protein
VTVAVEVRGESDGHVGSREVAKTVKSQEKHQDFQSLGVQLVGRRHFNRPSLLALSEPMPPMPPTMPPHIRCDLGIEPNSRQASPQRCGLFSFSAAAMISPTPPKKLSTNFIYFLIFFNRYRLSILLIFMR